MCEFVHLRAWRLRDLGEPSAYAPKAALRSHEGRGIHRRTLARNTLRTSNAPDVIPDFRPCARRSLGSRADYKPTRGADASGVIAAMMSAASRASHSKPFGLHFKDRHPRALDTCFEIRIAHCARFEEIDWATEESSEALFETKIGF